MYVYYIQTVSVNTVDIVISINTVVIFLLRQSENNIYVYIYISNTVSIIQCTRQSIHTVDFHVISQHHLGETLLDNLGWWVADVQNVTIRILWERRSSWISYDLLMMFNSI